MQMTAPLVSQYPLSPPAPVVAILPQLVPIGLYLGEQFFQAAQLGLGGRQLDRQIIHSACSGLSRRRRNGRCVLSREMFRRPFRREGAE